jgi:hypothetical protein
MSVHGANNAFFNLLPCQDSDVCQFYIPELPYFEVRIRTVSV